MLLREKKLFFWSAESEFKDLKNLTVERTWIQKLCNNNVFLIILTHAYDELKVNLCFPTHENNLQFKEVSSKILKASFLFIFKFFYAQNTDSVIKNFKLNEEHQVVVFHRMQKMVVDYLLVIIFSYISFIIVFEKYSIVKNNTVFQQLIKIIFYFYRFY